MAQLVEKQERLDLMITLANQAARAVDPVIRITSGAPSTAGARWELTPLAFSPYHTAMLAYYGFDGYPRARQLVILRGTDHGAKAEFIQEVERTVRESLQAC